MSANDPKRTSRNSVQLYQHRSDPSRRGQLPEDVTWERFSDELCVQVENISRTDDDGTAEGADPILRAVAPG